MTLLLLAAWTVLYRLVTMDIPEPAVDALAKWAHAKQLVLGVPQDLWTHHTARWAMILPAALAARLFGLQPITYYLPTLAISAALSAVFFAFTRRWMGSWPALFGSLILVVHPQMIRNGAQLLPGVYSAFFVFVTSALLIEFRRTAAVHRLLSASLCCFLAYGVKVSNLFFLPAFLAILMCGGAPRRERLRRTALFCIPLLFLIAAETALLWLVFDVPLGRLGLILDTHIDSRWLQPIALSDIFNRFFKLPAALALLFWPAAAAGLFALRRNAPLYVRHFACGFFCFLFGLTFSFKSLNPFVPALVGNPRYLVVVMPHMVLLLVELVRALAARLLPQTSAAGSAGVLSALGIPALLFCAIVASAFRIDVFFSLNDHLKQARADVSSALKRGEAVVVYRWQWRWMKYALLRLLLDEKVYEFESACPYPAMRLVSGEKHSFYVTCVPEPGNDSCSGRVYRRFAAKPGRGFALLPAPPLIQSALSTASAERELAARRPGRQQSACSQRERDELKFFTARLGEPALFAQKPEAKIPLKALGQVSAR